LNLTSLASRLLSSSNLQTDYKSVAVYWENNDWTLGAGLESLRGRAGISAPLRTALLTTFRYEGELSDAEALGITLTLKKQIKLPYAYLTIGLKQRAPLNAQAVWQEQTNSQSVSTPIELDDLLNTRDYELGDGLTMTASFNL
ncbi:MAG: hypothetical protein R3309_14630, partial [Reinekea sp.]|nr:hypothetical protein [Reinekea sp.]